MYCHACGYHNPEDASLCNECGTTLRIICSSCGSVVGVGEKFCHNCGTCLTIAASSPRAHAAPTASPCPFCGNHLSLDARSCSSCNAQLPMSEHEKQTLAKLRSNMPESLTDKILLGARGIEGERKHVTIMFADISGFTSMSERLDPEEILAIMNRCFKELTEVIYRYEGTIDKFIGDCMMVLFGAPVTHEDDPDRAVRAALDILPTLEKLCNCLPVRLGMHIGINSGLVIAGGIGSDLRMQYTVIGDAVNVAQRLQSAAKPGQIFVGESTYLQTRDNFDYEIGGELTLKGKSEPVKVYIPLHARPRQSRFEVSKKKGLTPFVGRQEELSLVRELFTKASQGHGQALGIRAEPGAGKTRLLHEFRQTLQRETWFLECQCATYTRESPYYPIIKALAQYWRLPEQPGQKMRQALVQRLGTLKDYVPCFEDLFSLPPSDPEYLQLSPPMRRNRTIEGMTALFQSEAADRPVVISIDDIQWADPSTEGFVAACLDVIGTHRIFLLLLSRPEFRPSWLRHASYTQITLSRLANKEGEHLVEALFDAPVSEELEEYIIGQTGGNPLFAEELVRVLRQNNALKCNGRYELARSPRELGIPATVQGLLSARIDLLDDEKKHALHVASVIGQEFSVAILKQGLKSNQQLGTLLDSLSRSEFICPRQASQSNNYSFNHILTRDVAYNSMRREKRRQLHRDVGEALLELQPEIKVAHPEIIAYHYTEAGLPEQAIPYWQQAGQKAIQRSASLEAIAHLSKGIELLKTLPSTPERAQTELALQLELGVPVMAVKGSASIEARQVFSRARELCLEAGQTKQIFPALRGLWLFYNMRSDMVRAREIAEQFMILTKREANPASILEAHRAMGITLMGLAELIPAREHFERCIELYDPLKHTSHAYLYGQDPAVATLSNLAWLLWILGYPDQALKKIEQALARARETAHPYSLGGANTFAAIVYQLRREVTAAREHAEAAIAISESRGFPFLLGMSVIIRGWTLVEQGKTDEGIREIKRGLADYRATGAEFWRTDYLALLAETYGRVGHIDEGLNTLAEALDALNRTGEVRWQAELFRLKGVLLMKKRNEDEEAERYMIRAMEVARFQKARSLELRASIDLSRLWQKQGKSEKAQMLLKGIYGWFTEGFTTADLKDADALMRDSPDKCA